MNFNIERILVKEMTRKEFLIYLGMFILTLFGISRFLKEISFFNSSTKIIKQPKLAKSKSSFGQGAYGV